MIIYDNMIVYNISGTYGDWSNECDPGSAICAMRVNFKPDSGIFGDDVALSDVQFKCCSI